MDVAFIYAGCQTAFSTVQTCVSAYKQLKATGNDVSGIVNEVGGCLSKFMHGQHQLEEAHEAAKQERIQAVKEGKKKDVTMEAIDNVIRIRQIRQQHADLAHMVRYELGMPDLWVDIMEERKRLVEEREQIIKEEEERARQAKLKNDLMIETAKEHARLVGAVISAVAFIAEFLWLLYYLVEEDKAYRWTSSAKSSLVYLSSSA